MLIQVMSEREVHEMNRLRRAHYALFLMLTGARPFNKRRFNWAWTVCERANAFPVKPPGRPS